MNRTRAYGLALVSISALSTAALSASSAQAFNAYDRAHLFNAPELEWDPSWKGQTVGSFVVPLRRVTLKEAQDYCAKFGFALPTALDFAQLYHPEGVQAAEESQRAGKPLPERAQVISPAGEAPFYYSTDRYSLPEEQRQGDPRDPNYGTYAYWTSSSIANEGGNRPYLFSESNGLLVYSPSDSSVAAVRCVVSRNCDSTDEMFVGPKSSCDESRARYRARKR